MSTFKIGLDKFGDYAMFVIFPEENLQLYCHGGNSFFPGSTPAEAQREVNHWPGDRIGVSRLEAGDSGGSARVSEGDERSAPGDDEEPSTQTGNLRWSRDEPGASREAQGC